MKYFYHDSSGKQCGPIAGNVLLELAKKGLIEPETMIITEGGSKVFEAQKVKGIEFKSVSKSVFEGLSVSEEETDETANEKEGLLGGHLALPDQLDWVPQKEKPRKKEVPLGSLDIIETENNSVDPSHSKPTPKQVRENMGCAIGCFALLAVLFILGSIGGTLDSSGTYNSVIDKADGINYAEEVVKRNLNFPDTAKFEFGRERKEIKPGIVEVKGVVQGKNAFGVPSSYRYRVRVRYDKKTSDWILEENTFIPR